MPSGALARYTLLLCFSSGIMIGTKLGGLHNWSWLVCTSPLWVPLYIAMLFVLLLTAVLVAQVLAATFLGR